MAVIGFTIGTAVQFPGGHLIYPARPAVAEAITTSGTSAASTGTVPGGANVVATVSVPDGAKVWATFGAGTPTASAGTTHLLGPGRHDFGDLTVGHKLAVVDA
jgi:hypothetical protein